MGSTNVSKARNTDSHFCGTVEGTTGPVEKMFGTFGEVKGVVVSAFGEGSEDLHSPFGKVGFDNLFPEEDLVSGGGESPGKTFAE